MRIAIIVPTLDEAAGIATTLVALQHFRDAGHRVIVADGGSTDATTAIASPLCDGVVIASRGRARQMNAGVAAVERDVDAYLFLHADTRLPDNALDAVTAALSSSKTLWGRFDVRISGRSRWLPVVSSMMNWRSRFTGIATGDQAMFVTRDAFECAGRFPDWPLMEDIGLSRNLKRGSRPAALRDRVVTSGRRWDARGPLRTIALMWWLRFCFAVGAKPEWISARYAAVR